jgi:hypothetical protein
MTARMRGMIVGSKVKYHLRAARRADIVFSVAPDPFLSNQYSSCGKRKDIGPAIPSEAMIFLYHRTLKAYCASVGRSLLAIAWGQWTLQLLRQLAHTSGCCGLRASIAKRHE